MKNYRELLTLAAQVAGIALTWSTDNDLAPRRVDTFATWNPSDDDGDALRLAVRLGITIALSAGEVKAWLRIDPAVDDPDTVPTRTYETIACFADHAGDREAATRFAILSTAATVARNETGWWA